MKKLIETMQYWVEHFSMQVSLALILVGTLSYTGGAWLVEQGAPDIVALICGVVGFSLWGLAGLLMTIRQEFYFIIPLRGPTALFVNILFTVVCWLVVGYLIVVMIMHYL